jgi:hypothetical protein
MTRPPHSRNVAGSLSAPYRRKAFTDEQVREIREEHAEGATARDLAAKYGVGYTAMRNLLTRRSYGWVR